MNNYSGTAKFLHWLIAAMVIGLIAVGFYMTAQKLSPQVISLYKLHKSTGLLVLALMLARLIWRWRHRPPPLPGSIAAWQQAASRISHGLLYLLLFLMPTSGWLMNSTSGTPMRWFGTFLVPALVERNPEQIELWKQVHFYSAWLLVTLIGLHIAAALKHHFVDKDHVMQRMLPTRK
jgi:cytochrome b561